MSRARQSDVVLVLYNGNSGWSGSSGSGGPATALAVDTEKTIAGVVLEPVQGEGGIRCADAEFMRVMLRDIVEEMDLSVIGEAVNGDEAITMYRQLNPDLVLLDITMPVMDGTEALDSILEYDANANVVMITALGQREQVLPVFNDRECRNFVHAAIIIPAQVFGYGPSVGLIS